MVQYNERQIDSFSDRSRLPNGIFFMGSMLGDWPSIDPHNFSQHRPSDPSNPSKLMPATYHPTHNRTVPPPNQVITTEPKNTLWGQLYRRAEEKLRLQIRRPKRAASENLASEQRFKQLRGSFPEESSN